MSEPGESDTAGNELPDSTRRRSKKMHLASPSIGLEPLSQSLRSRSDASERVVSELNAAHAVHWRVGSGGGCKLPAVVGRAACDKWLAAVQVLNGTRLSVDDVA